MLANQGADVIKVGRLSVGDDNHYSGPPLIDGEPVGDGHLQGQFAALKDVVGDMIDKGVFTSSTARQYLRRKLAERVRDQQELLISTGESPFEKYSSCGQH